MYQEGGQRCNSTSEAALGLYGELGMTFAERGQSKHDFDLGQ